MGPPAAGIPTGSITDRLPGLFAAGLMLAADPGRLVAGVLAVRGGGPCGPGRADPAPARPFHSARVAERALPRRCGPGRR